MILERWKQPKLLSMDRRINKTWYIHTKGCHCATTRDEVRTRGTVLVDPKNMLMSERGQS